MKLQKFQRFSCIIPFYSTIFILVVTMIELKRHKATFKRWLQSFAVLTLSVFLVFLLNAYILAEQALALRIIVSAFVTTLTNLLLVEIQRKVYQEQVNIEFCEDSRKVEITAKISFLSSLGLCIPIIIFAILYSLFAPPHPYDDVEDVNGIENTSLAQITLNEILTTENTYSAKYVSNAYSGEQTFVDYTLSSYDYEHSVLTCKYISGIATLQATKIDSGTLFLDISPLVESGNAEIVIIVDGEYYSHIPINEEQTIELNNIVGKTVVVKAAFEGAKVDISLTRRIEF